MPNRAVPHSTGAVHYFQGSLIRIHLAILDRLSRVPRLGTSVGRQGAQRQTGHVARMGISRLDRRGCSSPGGAVGKRSEEWAW